MAGEVKVLQSRRDRTTTRSGRRGATGVDNAVRVDRKRMFSPMMSEVKVAWERQQDRGKR
jgi:hypothetical protein